MKLIGGTVNVSPGFSWPTQDISISGSTVNLQPGVNYNLGAANISGGGINVGGGASLQVDSMLHAGFSEIDGTLNVMHELDNEGFLKASSGASISAGMVSMGGIIDLFDGTLTSAGDMNLNGSSVLIAEVDASGSSVHAGRIEVGGTATLAGALGLSFVNDSVLLPHQSIEVMHWANHVGTFDDFESSSPYAGLSFQAVYTADQLDIVASAIDGDANLDGVVNLLDVNAVATDFGKTASQNWLDGDFSDDGAVNMVDFNLLAEHFGQTLPLADRTPLGALVPEPSSLLPLILPWIGTRRRRLCR
jgi:hypothetical protein